MNQTQKTKLEQLIKWASNIQNGLVDEHTFISGHYAIKLLDRYRDSFKGLYDKKLEFNFNLNKLTQEIIKDSFKLKLNEDKLKFIKASMRGYVKKGYYITLKTDGKNIHTFIHSNYSAEILSSDKTGEIGESYKTITYCTKYFNKVIEILMAYDTQADIYIKHKHKCTLLCNGMIKIYLAPIRVNG